MAWSTCWNWSARLEWCVKLDDASARMTVFLMWSSVGRWFLASSGGVFVRQGWPWRVDEVGGTGSMMGLLAALRIGVLVSRSMIENTATRFRSAPRSSTRRTASLLVALLLSLTLLSPNWFASFGACFLFFVRMRVIDEIGFAAGVHPYQHLVFYSKLDSLLY